MGTSIASAELDPDEERELGDEEVPVVALQPKISERRRAQIANFSSWVDKQARVISKDPVSLAVKSQDDEILSLRQLMAKNESEVIIASPRDYQIELFERAKDQNTIAVLPTGSGKTLISVLLLRHVIDRELEDRALGKPRRIAFFLVDKVQLVFQQFAVLERNLDQPIERFCGSMGCDLWLRETWEKHFAKNMIIVCTADVLTQCLMHSFITIEQINLLIFDEAHHAKKGHAYARIIKDFYLSQPDPRRRPRIFGMTASPVDVEAGDDLPEKAKELETLLHARIATTSDPTMLQKSVHKPMEQVAPYARLEHRFETPFYRQLWAQYYHLNDFHRIFESAKDISSDLGRWCSDRYWSFAFSEREERKIEAKVESRFYKRKKHKLTETLDAEIAELREAQAAIKAHNFGLPSVNLQDLSAKVIKLYECLQLYFERSSETRCLVFVERRHTARILKILFDHIGGPHMRTGAIIGSSSQAADGQATSSKQAVLTLVKFRKGELNCLFATSVAEEGLDIPGCNLVIRFDPVKTMIQNVQSRGRARHKNSKFIHLLEEGNLSQEETWLRVVKSELLMHKFCRLLPEDRHLLGDADDNMNGILDKDRNQRTYTEKSTGAKLTYDFSLVVLAHFVGCLPHDDGDDMTINYVLTVREGKFVCEVILPVKSPIVSTSGLPAKKKSIAKRSAAFSMCIELRKGKYLDANLLPIYTKQLPAMRNAHLALHSKGSNMYKMQLKPTLWENGRGAIPEKLFLTVITLQDPWDRPVQPLGLLTREPLVTLPPFPLYRITGKTSRVLTIALSQSLDLDAVHRVQLTSFTLRVLKDLFNKTYEFDETKMSYWLAPLHDLPISVAANYETPQDLIEWSAVVAAHSREPDKWTKNTPDAYLADKFLIDNWDGGRRFFTVGVTHNHKAMDPVPKDTAPAHRSDNILNYTVSLWKKSRLRRTWDESQPVIEAEKVLHRLNVLADPTEAEQVALTKCFVCPEPLGISLLSTRVVAMGLLFPAIIHRLESYLTALEFCKEINIDVGPALALEAVTKDSDNTDETHGERINFQRGMGSNYERLEFIGDCFLKMATSISLFARFASNDEYAMHVDRMLMVCNKNMFDNAKKMEWSRYIRGLSFSRRTWYPIGLKLLDGKGAGKDQSPFINQPLADKTIADVCEALIGAAFVAHVKSGYDDVTHYDDAVRAVTAFVRSPNHAMDRWADYYKAYAVPKYQLAETTASQRDLAAQVEMKHPYRFRHPRLLQSAFLHPSNPRSWENIPSYQRLEFLGDSLLDMACVTHLFDRYPTKDPQWLTEHKMAMVSNKFFGALCVKIGFHRHLRHNSSVIGHQIGVFVDEIQELEQESKGSRNYWTLAKDPPKCLPDMIESYAGALFVDSAFSYAPVQHFFDTHILPFFSDMSLYDTFANAHPTTKLHQLLSISLGCRNYRLMSQDLPSQDGKSAQGGICLAGLMVHDAVVAQGRAASSKVAKIHASADALKVLDGVAPFEFRERYGCDCGGVGGTVGAGLGGGGSGGGEELEGIIEEMMGTAI